jgi:methionyl-tRNA synthetase
MHLRALPGSCLHCRPLVALPRALHALRRASTVPAPYFVTTPVFYANAQPHIGHLYTCVLADAYARHARLSRPGAGALLSTGTDEHGQKVAAAAQARGQTPAAWCDAVSGGFAECLAAFDVTAGQFTRTSSAAHGRVVRWMWRRLAARGHIYLGQHEGWYCASEEAFLTPLQLCTRAEYLEKRGLSEGGVPLPAAAAAAPPPPPPLPVAAPASAPAAATPAAAAVPLSARVSLESGHPVEWVSEDNYKFRLAACAPALARHYASDPDFVLPRERLAEVAAFVASGEVRDLSVSRRRDRVAWAWPTPEGAGEAEGAAAPQQQHSVYVWLDALCNYLTAALAPAHAEGQHELPQDVPWQELFPAWPADLHVVGKDIVKFHALYWPAFLHAAGLPLPRRILAHGHFTVARQKMSKSLGNCIEPLALLRAPSEAGGGAPAPPHPLAGLGGPYTVDGVRFALLREGIVGEDGDFNPSVLEQRAAKECADTFGNLASRLLTPRFMPVGGCVTVAPVPLALPWGPGGGLGAAGLTDPRGTAGSADPSLHPSAQLLPLSAEHVQLLCQVDALWACMEGGMGEGRGPAPGLAACVSALQEANRVFTRAEPWKHVAGKEEVAAWKGAVEAAGVGGVAGAPGSARWLPPGSLALGQRTLQLAALSYTLAETLRVCAILLQLATPRAAGALLAHMGFPPANSGVEGRGEGHALAQWAAARVGAARPHDFAIAATPLPILFPKAKP